MATEKLHTCPFPRCDCSYTRRGKLRDHVMRQKLVYDEVHPKDDPAWEVADNDGLLTVHTRPKSMTKEERVERRKATGRRCWDKNKEAYLEQQRIKRERVHSALLAARKLTTIIQSHNSVRHALLTAMGSSNVSRTLYRKSISLANWLGPEINIQTFPRFVTYYFAPFEWPVVEIGKQSWSPTTTKCAEAVPGKQFYKDMTRWFHPDKSSRSSVTTRTNDNTSILEDDENQERRSTIRYRPPHRLPEPWAQTHLNAGWEIWRSVIEDKDLMDWVLFASDTENDFRAQSEKHAELSGLYWEWMDVVLEARTWLVTESATIDDVDTTFMSDLVPFLNDGPGNDAKALLHDLENAPIAGRRGRKRTRPQNHSESEESEESE